MKQRVSLLRILVTGTLSIVLVPISWAATLFLTLGIDVARRVTPDTASWVGSNERLGVAITIDFLVWFAALWGLQRLWFQFRGELEDRDTRLWPNHPPRRRIVGNAMLFALPLSYYVLLAAEIVLNRGVPLESDLSFIAAVALSLASCAAVVCGLFAVAVRFWPRSAVRN